MVVRYGGAALSRGDVDTFKSSASFSLGLDLLSGLVGMAVAMLLLPLLAGWFGLPDKYLGMAMAYCLLIPTMGASSPTGMLRALDRFDLISWQGSTYPIVRAILAGIAWAMDARFEVFLLIW